MEKLKPCPFCGEIPEIFPIGRSFAATFWINCKCGVQLGSPPGADLWGKQDAIAAWNKRKG